MTGEYGEGEPIGLDLGWIVVRPIPMEQYQRIYRGDSERRTRAEIAWHAGVPLRSFSKLTAQQIDEVWYGMGWLLRPNLTPHIGTVVNPEKVAALRGPPRPEPKLRKLYTRKAKTG
ncbi:hypothetical protein [Aureimonas psammosilenae]|uniref:hypothetical protein n=1 Tax=Aureimonas psammosilenae TaxID=2495496 RepID=UPI001260840D|nr:hypothetical protein [Aureimonas psammosilenae]